MIKRSKGLALFIIRLIVGLVFIAHGGQKVFGWFGGPGLQGWANWLGAIGVSAWMAYAAAFGELLAGVMMFLGFAAELGALLGIFVMVGAIYLVHWPHGFFIQNNGFEYALVLMLCCLSIIVGGPGRWHLWDPCKKLK